MKYAVNYIILSILMVAFIASCSDTQDDLSVPPEVGIHPEGTINPNSDNFHAFLLKDNGFDACQECHAVDFSGGPTKVNCGSSDCHPTIGVHAAENIIPPSSENFHGKFLSDNSLGMTDCAQCHGDDLTGGLVATACTQCHGSINVHREGVLNPASANFHGKYIMSAGWDMGGCQQCHGDDYTGGLLGTACTTCHVNEGGPEACNTCHGDFGNPDQVNPPQALDGSTETTASGVGAHVAHLQTAGVACGECHIYPDSFGATGHIDGDGHAELIFGDLANSGAGNAEYSHENLTCQNTYCHGDFSFDKASSEYAFAYVEDQMTGNNYQPIWNQVDGTQAACGTCHGLPPTGHVAAELNACVNCHPDVVDGDGNIIDNTKHVNGEKNVFGN